jgi:hypothetical protein
MKVVWVQRISRSSVVTAETDEEKSPGTHLRVLVGRVDGPIERTVEDGATVRLMEEALEDVEPDVIVDIGRAPFKASDWHRMRELIERALEEYRRKFGSAGTWPRP